jgi:coenzyme F420-0:L-glutamate ligase/coenzyme F420-1:gamma-L-glutamate ligase
MTYGLQILPVLDMPEIHHGQPVAELIAQHVELHDNDVVVIASKIIAKAEGRVVAVEPGERSKLVEEQAVRVLRRRGDLTITETEHGFVCAHAGVDSSNVEPGHAVLLPRNPDRSARKIHDRLRGITNTTVGVIISDTFGRAWRNGVTDVALGCAGIKPILDLRGETDTYGNVLSSTQVCIVDELAGAAELVMGKCRQVPVVVIRGIDPSWFTTTDDVTSAVIRKPADDLFR